MNKTETGTKKIIALEIKQRRQTVELSGPYLIVNLFGMDSITDILAKHLNPKDLVTEERPPKTLEGEILSHLTFDHKGRVAFLARHIKKSMINAFNIAVLQTDNKTKNATSFRKNFRIEGLEEPHFCPISWREYQTRVDNVVLSNGTSSVAVRPMFIDWKIRCNIVFQQDLINEEDILKILGHTGLQIGLGAWTPPMDGDFGLFNVKCCKFSEKDRTKQPKFNKAYIEKGFKSFLLENSRNPDILKKFKMAA